MSMLQALEAYSENLNKRDISLLERAIKVLESNKYEEYKDVFKGRTLISPDKKCFNGVWNWDSAFHAIGVARFDKEAAFEQIEGFLSYIKEDGMLPDNLLLDGGIGWHSSKPPVFAWAALEVARLTGDSSILVKVYDKLALNASFWETQRSYNGLFHYDAYMQGSDEEKDVWARWESGWDNSVRWDKGIFDIYPVDLNCFMFIFYKSMAEISEMIGKPAGEWKEKSDRMSKLIEDTFWNDELEAYTDRYFSGEYSSCLSPASFMPLFARCASRERAEKMAKLAADKERFNSTMPTVSFDDPGYSTDYWRGPLWMNTAYFAAKGLKNYEFPSADAIKENVLALVDSDKEHIYENYDVKNNVGLCARNFSWSACFIIEFILDW